MSWRQSSVHMERALLERCPNTFLRRRASGGFQKVQPRIVSDLSLPSRALRPVATLAAPPAPNARAAPPAPRYTSLAEIISTGDCAGSVAESVSSPRTPMRNGLVEKAARAYLLPSDSFNKTRHSPQSSSSSWSGLSRFLPRLSVLTMALNPLNAFTSAFQVFRFYLTGARAFQPQLATVSRSVSRSFSMPIQRISYAHDLSIY